MKNIQILTLLVITFNLLGTAFANVNKPVPTQEKPIFGGVPPKPPSSIVDEKDGVEFVDYKKKSSELEQSNKKLTEQKNSLEGKNTELTNANEQLLNKQKELEQKLESVTTERNSLFKSVQDSNNKIASLQSSHDNLQQLVDSVANQAENTGSIFNGWVYCTELGWVFVSPSTLPYFYVSNGGWVYYERGSSPRKFYFFETSSWKLLEN